nr:zinc finger, CCHC-type, retrotransposon Gag domain protein [Tanacetum cinerariifolium]
RGVTILVSEPGYETVGSKDLTCEDWMVNTRTDADLSAAVQNALQTLLPQIREEIREEFRTGSGSSNAGGNPPPVTIHTWLERFNKQKPHSFEKATAPVDAENWISHMEKIFDVMGCEDAFKTRLAVYKFEGNALAWWKAYKQAKGGDAWLVTVTWADFKKLFFLQFFPRAEQERLKREYHSIRQTSTETSTEFMQRFLRLAGFLGAAAGTEEEQAKNFQWGLRRSTLNHLMCMSYTDVAQVANAARNYEILHERDDDDTERPDKRQRSGDRHQPTSQQSSHRSHGHNNDRHGSDRRGGNDNHRGSNNNNYSSSNNRNSGNGQDQRNRGHQSNRFANSGSQQSRGPSEGYSYPVCTTCGRRHQGECRRAAGTCFKCGQAGHLQKDCKKNTTTSTSSQADKMPGVQVVFLPSMRVRLLIPQ